MSPCPSKNAYINSLELIINNNKKDHKQALEYQKENPLKKFDRDDITKFKTVCLTH